MGQRVVHGALDHAELARLGLKPADLLDFSSNLNPFGPPESVRTALAQLDLAPYPDRSCLALREVLAAQHRLAPAQILPGNGANELIHLLARALLVPGETALVIEPTYGEYREACRLSGARVIAWQAHAADAFALDLPAISALIATERPRLTWLCAPNNPTGTAPTPGEVHALTERCAAVGGLLVADRAYAAFLRSAHATPLDQPLPPNLLQLHSLTKSYALAGLRLGYLLGTPELVERVAAFQPAWSVSSVAQAAGLAVLADPDFLPTTLPRLWAASDELLAGLRALGLTVWRSALPFLLVHVGDAAATRTVLLARGCVVRDGTSFGLPTWVRVAPGQPEANARLLAGWRKSVTSCDG